MSEIPQHIAIVMDGNGRWAKKRNLPRIAGHKVGADVINKITEHCSNIGVKVLTLFAFSTENWLRPSDEVSFLMNLLFKKLESETEKLNENNVQLHVIGDIAGLNKKLQNRINESVRLTANNTGIKLIFAFNYSGRWDILQATKKIGDLIQKNKLMPHDISVDTIQKYICLSDLPEPDLFIRTSGEQRISNFMLWQLAYTELYFTDILWPDFDEAALNDAIKNFSKRERRFGRVSATT